MAWRAKLGLGITCLLVAAVLVHAQEPLEIVLPPLTVGPASFELPLDIAMPPLAIKPARFEVPAALNSPLPILAQAQPKDVKPTPGQTQPKVEAPGEPQLPRDLFSQADTQGPADSSSSSGGHPYMVGDLVGGAFVVRTITLPTTVTLNVVVGEQLQQVTVPGTTTRQYTIPLAALGSFKVGENESPVPRDRVFATYNYFSNVATLPTSGDSAPSFSTASLNLNPFSPVDVVGFTPSQPLNRLNVHRETIGIEKLFFGEDFSLTLRVPYIQQTGVSEIAGSQIGNVSILAKYAVINNRTTGNVLSGGVMLTLPTGQEIFNVEGFNLNTPLIQPWVGYFVNVGNFFFQGFSSVIVPTNFDNVTLLCNDFGMGYRLYRNNNPDALVRFLFPAVEGHLTNPLTHRGIENVPVGFPDIFITTAAMYVGLGSRTTLTLGAAAPLTGPRPFDVEGIVQLNFFY